jgi:hypothetical protein
MEVQLEIAKRVGFLSEEEHDRLQKQVEAVGLNALLTSMQDLDE